MHRSSSYSLVGKAIREQGLDNFVIEPLDIFRDDVERFEKERQAIIDNDCVFPKGYNREIPLTFEDDSAFPALERYARKSSLGKKMAEKNIDIERLSRETGLSIPTLYRVIRGENVSLLNAQKIARVLGETLSTLWGDE